MTAQSSYDQARGVLDVLQEMYRNEANSQIPYGHWLLTKFYPGIEDPVLNSCDDIATTRALMLTRFATNRLDFGKVAHLYQDSF